MNRTSMERCPVCGRVYEAGSRHTCRPKMMPGQEPYTDDELRVLYAWIHDAALGDPGEVGEIEDR